MATVHRPDGTVRRVRNLGWLLRHWQEVAAFRIHPLEPADPHRECLLVAELRDGGQYRTTWASGTLCIDWLDRPVFRGLPVSLHAEPARAY